MSTAVTQRRRIFKKFSYRGVELKALLDLSTEQLLKLLPCRQRRRFVRRGIQRKTKTVLKKLRKEKRLAPEGEKPAPVKTHLRDMIIVPEMIGSQMGIYNGLGFVLLEVKPEMIGHYVGEFAMTYKPVRHGRPGIGSTHSSRFIPLN